MSQNTGFHFDVRVPPEKNLSPRQIESLAARMRSTFGSDTTIEYRHSTGYLEIYGRGGHLLDRRRDPQPYEIVEAFLRMS